MKNLAIAITVAAAAALFGSPANAQKDGDPFARFLAGSTLVTQEYPGVYRLETGPFRALCANDTWGTCEAIRCLDGNRRDSPSHAGGAFMAICNGSLSQLWRIERLNNGYRLMSVLHNGECLMPNDPTSFVNAGAAHLGDCGPRSEVDLTERWRITHMTGSYIWVYDRAQNAERFHPWFALEPIFWVGGQRQFLTGSALVRDQHFGAVFLSTPAESLESLGGFEGVRSLYWQIVEAELPK
jgi:hypothetical protein